MKARIIQIVEDHWSQQRLPALTGLVDETVKRLEEMLALEAHYRDTRKGAKRMGQSLGQFGAAALDMKSLSTMLHKSHHARVMDKERHQRLKNIYEGLAALRASYRQTPPQCHISGMESGPEAIFRAFENHYAAMTKAFRLLRIGKLEIRGRYDREIHDPFFEQFNWRHLDNDEMLMCPPFVVFLDEESHPGESLGPLIELETAGKPIKAVVCHASLNSNSSETGRAAALKSSTDATLLFLALRNVFFLQSSFASPTDLGGLIGESLDSPRPGVISLFASDPAKNAHDLRAARALASRGFPHFVFDPDRASDFVSCLDLSQNPAVDRKWAPEVLEYVSEDGETQELERPFTFADFAAGEPEYENQFTAIGPEQNRGQETPLADFLELTAAERRGKRPFIQGADPDGKLTRLEPSRSMVAQTADRLHLWHTLQELAGIMNPHVQAAEKRTAQAAAEEKARALAELRERMDAETAERERTAVSAAMMNLARRLTGTAAAGTPQPDAPAAEAAPTSPQLQPGPAPSAPAPAPEAEEPPATASAAAADAPWIDERLCTTCDECTDINKKIFAYNAEKMAYIKDAAGGPFRDIVKAAEKCASDAIHPGKPLDPEEKDLEKWVQRAEPFQ